MLEGLKKRMAVSITGGTLRSLAQDKNTRTTITGMIAAAVLAIPGFDLARLIDGDAAQIAKVISAVLVFLVGLFATREKADGATTALGAAAGAVYACQGSVEAIVTGVVVAVLGHLTNKPVTNETGKQQNTEDAQG